MLSAVVITHNEEDWIENCLASVKPIADEVIVVDDGSTDNTVAICKKLGAKVFHHDWEGFSKQKNFAVSKTSGDWLLFIDADERVSKGLAQEIQELVKNHSLLKNDSFLTTSAYAMPRQNIILGQKMRHGGWWPDYVTRLVRKDSFVGWEGNLHESLQAEGEIRRLQHVLYHLTHRGITWMLTTSINYTPIEAKLRFEANHPKVTWWRLFRVMATEFWYRFFVKSGWRDGTVGVIEAISQSYNLFLVYVHLWEMQKGKSMEEIYKKIDSDLVSHGF